MKYISSIIQYEVGDYITCIKEGLSAYTYGKAYQIRECHKSYGVMDRENFRPSTQEEINEINKPKYKVGDWVVMDCGAIVKITSMYGMWEYDKHDFSPAKSGFLDHTKWGTDRGYWWSLNRITRLATPKEIKQQMLRDKYPMNTYLLVTRNGANDSRSEFYKTSTYKDDVVRIDRIVIGSDSDYLIAVGTKGEALHLEEMEDCFRIITETEEKISVGEYYVTFNQDSISVGCQIVTKEVFMKIANKAGWI